MLGKATLSNSVSNARLRSMDWPCHCANLPSVRAPGFEYHRAVYPEPPVESLWVERHNAPDVSPGMDAYQLHQGKTNCPLSSTVGGVNAPNDETARGTFTMRFGCSTSYRRVKWGAEWN